MSRYTIYLTKQAFKDLEEIKRLKIPSLSWRVEWVTKLLQKDPMMRCPSFKKLTGDFEGLLARKLSHCRLLIYQVLEEKKAIKIVRMLKDQA